MQKSKVPPGANVYVELGNKLPREVNYLPTIPYRLCWIITNGVIRKRFLWIVVRKTGIYVALGMPDGIHTSYHNDGRFQWRSKELSIDERFKCRPPLDKLDKPILIQNATSSIDDSILDGFDLSNFSEDELINEIIYLDNRALPQTIYYEVWAVPPFLHSQVSLHTDSPAHLHMVTHTNPWILVLIYDQEAN